MEMNYNATTDQLEKKKKSPFIQKTLLPHSNQFSAAGLTFEQTGTMHSNIRTESFAEDACMIGTSRMHNIYSQNAQKDASTSS